MEVDVAARETIGRVKAMASQVCVRVVPGDRPDAAVAGVAAALSVFVSVEASCTRFDPNSPLMRANAGPSRWHRVPRECFEALSAAYAAYQVTEGRFDPRVLDDLCRLGYAHSVTDPDRPTSRELAGRVPPEGRPERAVWSPRFRPESREVWLGPDAIDLGGIGKGLAVRRAGARLRGVGAGALVEAGGDCYCTGSSPEGGLWRIAVEDPNTSEPAAPVAVLGLTDLACATSSIRIRRWRVGAAEVHHILEPRTGLPGGDGLSSVTVVGADAALAEVWSKALFLFGSERVAAAAARRGIAAYWVDRTGRCGSSPEMSPHLLWERT